MEDSEREMHWLKASTQSQFDAVIELLLEIKAMLHHMETK